MIYVQDSDFTLHVGDVRDVLRDLPDESVDCVVTSPPYWGLRDYGTGEWEGGNGECDHHHDTAHQKQGATSQRAGRTNVDEQRNENFRDVCGKCGATRTDRQLGLEPTPEEYVANMVEVFREVRRVLAKHGTCWVNLGDSYSSSQASDSRSSEERSRRSTLGPKRNGLGGDNAAHVARSFEPRPLSTGLKPKDLVGIPWRIAFALQADGWYLRSDIIWAKPNPMPESVTDRPTKAHEYVFLLTKQARYFFDQEAVREGYDQGWAGRRDAGTGSNGRLGGPGGWTGRGPDGRRKTTVQGGDGSEQHRDGERWPNPAGRNIRSVWEIATQPYPEAHFATYPEALVERCLKAGCPEQVCRVCGKPRERIVERELVKRATIGRTPRLQQTEADALNRTIGNGSTVMGHYETQTLGFTDCGHGNYRPGVVLDPFLGSGTTALVARRHGRHCIGIELNQTYAELAAKRLNQLSLLA